MRWFLTILAWVIATAVLAPVCFFGALVLAGPHSSLLPSFLQPLALALAWGALLLVPIVVARVTWMRLGRARSAGSR